MTDERRARQMVQYHNEGEHVFPEPECPSCRLDVALRRAALLAGARRWQPTASEPRYWEAVEGWAGAIQAHAERPESEHDGGCSAGISKAPCKCSQRDRADATATFIRAMLGGDDD